MPSVIKSVKKVFTYIKPKDDSKVTQLKKLDLFQGDMAALNTRNGVRWRSLGKTTLTLLSNIESSVNAWHRKDNLDVC